MFLTVLQETQCSSSSLDLIQKNTLITSDMIGQDQNCINQNAPFMLSTKPGQTLNITLIDLNSNQNQMAYGKIKDGKMGNEITLRSETRVSHIFVSSGNQVEVTFYTSSMRFALDITGMGFHQYISAIETLTLVFVFMCVSRRGSYSIFYLTVNCAADFLKCEMHTISVYIYTRARTVA